MPRSDHDQMIQEIEQLKREQAETNGLLTILRHKLQDSNEEIFDLRANMATIEAEANYTKSKAQKENIGEIQKLESKLLFMENELKQATRGRVRAQKDLESIRRTAQMEQKRLSAQKRLEETKRRQLEQKQQLILSQAVPVLPPIPTPNVVIQEEKETKDSVPPFLIENAKLISQLTEEPLSQHLLAMLSVEAFVDEPKANVTISLSQREESTTDRVNASSNKDLGVLLHEAISLFLTGKVTSLILLPVFVDFMNCADELPPETHTSVLRIFHAVMQLNGRFKDFICNPMNKTMGSSLQSRVSNVTFSPGILEQYEPSCKCAYSKDFSSVSQAFRGKALAALCRLLKNHLSSIELIASGLSVLSYWTSCPNTDLYEFEMLVTNRVLQDILLSPNSSLDNQSACVDLFGRLIRSNGIFDKLMTLSKQSLLFNRMARMLSSQKQYLKTRPSEKASLQTLLLKVVSLLSTVIAANPTYGIPFLLQYTRGNQNEVDGEKSIVYHLIVLLNHETERYRTKKIDIQPTSCEIQLIRDSFTLFVFLVHYVELAMEVQDCRQIQVLHCILLWVGTGVLDHDEIDSYSKSAHLLLSLLELSP